MNGKIPGGSTRDHVVEIDCQQKLILDCVEEYSIRVIGDSIHFCRCYDGHDMKFAELKRMNGKFVVNTDKKSTKRIRKPRKGRETRQGLGVIVERRVIRFFGQM